MIFQLPNNSKTELYIKDNGLIIKNKVMADKYGQKDLSMKVCGTKTWPTAKEGSFTQEAMFTKDNGSMTKQKVKVSICIKMEHHILANGWMTNNMDTVYRNGLMEHNMRAISIRVSKKAMELSFGQMAANIRVNLKITISKGLGIMFGLMAENMKDLGEITKCMVEAYLYGQMDENMKENI